MCRHVYLFIYIYLYTHSLMSEDIIAHLLVTRDYIKSTGWSTPKCCPIFGNASSDCLEEAFQTQGVTQSSGELNLFAAQLCNEASERIVPDYTLCLAICTCQAPKGFSKKITPAMSRASHVRQQRPWRARAKRASDGVSACGVPGPGCFLSQLFSGTLFFSLFLGGCPTKNGLPQKGFPFFPGSLNN